MMKLFLKRLAVFLSLVAIVFIVGILLPTTRRASGTLLFGQIKKDSLLIATSSPRIIFIGGSNLSFGLNSQMIYDSLHINPINTAIHAGLGLIFMINHTLPFIKKDDIVVVSPEYHQFYGDLAYGGEEMLRTVMEISRSDIKNLSLQQWKNMIAEMPKYSFSKFKPSEYFTAPDLSGLYSVNSFNKYGDAYVHWSMRPEKGTADGPISLSFNNDVLVKLLKFNDELKRKGAKLYITFPGYQSSSFENNTLQIAQVFSKLKENNFSILGTPQQFEIPDSLIFNTNYHLTKQGVDLRTKLLVQDLKQNGIFKK